MIEGEWQVHIWCKSLIPLIIFVQQRIRTNWRGDNVYLNGEWVITQFQGQRFAENVYMCIFGNWYLTWKLDKVIGAVLGIQ